MGRIWALWDQFPDARKLIRSLVLVDKSSVMLRDPHWTDDQVAELSADTSDETRKRLTFTQR